MAYVRIRHEVSKTYAVLDEGHDDRALLHFLFGRNRAVVGAAAPSRRARLATAMHELPDVVFALICRMLDVQNGVAKKFRGENYPATPPSETPSQHVHAVSSRRAGLP